MANACDSRPGGNDNLEERLRLALEDSAYTGARIKVIGVGGAGGNAVNRMVRAGFEGVQFIAANTDMQALRLNAAGLKLQLGAKLTKGLGAGADPNVGRQAALEDTDQIIEVLDGADMVFVTTGLGGGTGTGAAPVIASLASELGALTIAVVTKPFTFEGRKRALQAERGLLELREAVDSVITIPNERLLSSIDRRMPLADAFALADDVLRQAIQGISDLILVPGLINLDFPDVKTIMAGAGVAVMGTGVGDGENRAVDAARRAISSPLLEDASIEGARGVIINITGGADLSLFEVSEASGIIHQAAHEDASIIFGAAVDETLSGRVKITVIATGFDRADGQQSSSEVETPVDLQSYAAWSRGVVEAPWHPRAAAPATAAATGPGAMGERGISRRVRRPILDVPAADSTVDAGEPQAAAADASDFDVPAFLRRQREA